jgi:hypothetical protein
MKILVGFWTMTDEDAARRDALQQTGGDVIATSLQEAVDRIVAVARGATVALEAAPSRPDLRVHPAAE